MKTVIRHLRRAALLQQGSGPTDEHLLEMFLARRDEVAFEALMRRHGPMVLGVCQRLLRNAHDAEDAFQATFLVLLRKAGSLRSRALLANWLYGVAYRTAMKARAMNAKRRMKESQAGEVLRSESSTDEELLAQLDHELRRLPDKYRTPVILCELEGKSRKEVARLLGVPEGTLSWRLAQAKKLLAKRLSRHELALPLGVLAVGLSPTLRASTLQSVLTAGAVPAKVLALTEGVLKAMLLSKLKITAYAAALMLVAGVGMSGLTYRATAEEPAQGTARLTLPSSAADPQLYQPPRPALAKKDQGNLKKDQGNLKETVLALEKRVWEALKTQDRTVFQNLVADDFVGLDISGRHYDKADTLQFVSKVRVPEYEMKNVRVIVMNETSALVTYDIHYKLNHVDGEASENLDRHALRAWTQRNGKWWYVYYEDRLNEKAGRLDQLRE